MVTNILLGLVLSIASFAIYSIQLKVFHSPRDTFFYLFQDMAFVPLQVLIVTVVLEQLLSARDKREKLRKINIVISAFYSEGGTSLIGIMSGFNLNLTQLKDKLDIKGAWNDEQFKNTVKFVSEFDYETESKAGDLVLLKNFLLDKRAYILKMFENPNLLEHDTFTDMLWAVFHVADELESRESLSMLPETDMEHLSLDIKRAYRLLIIEWVYYMNHLKKEYPYLFSLAVRKNPFVDEKEVIIR